MLNPVLFVDDKVLIAEHESDLQNLVSVFDSVCKRRKLKVNVNKRKMMICKRSRSEVVDFVFPYRVGIECEKKCRIILNGKKWRRSMRLSTLDQLCVSHGGMEGDIRERALQGRRVAGSLGRIMNGRSVSMEVKRELRNTITVPTLTYASKTLAWNESQRSRVQAVEMSYLRGACGVSRIVGMSNESV